MSKKLITSLIFFVILIVFVLVSYIAIGTNKMTQNQAIALWFSAFGILIACGLSFLFAERKPFTSTISIIYVALTIALGSMEMCLNSGKGLDAKWTIIIQLVLLAFYVIACLVLQGSSTINDYEKDEKGKNIYKKAG